MDGLNVLGLFGGIGGFELGFERAGFRIVGMCEIDPYCRAVLRKYWPDVFCFSDVRTVNREALDLLGITVDVIIGGFPCQDISAAGKGAGLSGSRSGLWTEFHRVIKEVKPRFAVIENVSALRSRGLDQMLGSLAEIGYDAEWHCIPASAIGAPHRRDRIWIIAYTASDLRRASWHDGSKAFDGCGLFLADASSYAFARQRRSDPSDQRQSEQALQTEQSEFTPNASPQRYGQQEASVFAGRSGVEHCGWWAVEPNVGRVAYGVPDRVDRLRALGNAVVPQIPEIIAKAIKETIHGVSKMQRSDGRTTDGRLSEPL